MLHQAIGSYKFNWSRRHAACLFKLYVPFLFAVRFLRNNRTDTVCYNYFMRKIIIILLLFPTVALAQPTIIFDTETHDFGIVRGDEPLKHTFEVWNKGTEDLIIKRLDAP